MIFNYSDYFYGCFIIPLGLIALDVFVCMVILVSYWEKIVSHTAQLKDALVPVFALFVLCIMTLPSIFPFFKNGIHLIYEKENAAKEANGYIEEIEDARYHFTRLERSKDDFPKAVKFKIDGKEYIAVIREDFKFLEGDYVVVRYLPKSSYILSIENSND